MKYISSSGRWMVLAVALAAAAPALAQRSAPQERDRRSDEGNSAQREVRRVGRARDEDAAQSRGEAAQERAPTPARAVAGDRQAPPPASRLQRGPTPASAPNQSRPAVRGQARPPGGFERRDEPRDSNGRSRVQPQRDAAGPYSVPQRNAMTQREDQRGRSDRGHDSARDDHRGPRDGRGAQPSHGRRDDNSRGRLSERERQRRIVQQRQSVESYRGAVARHQQIERRRIVALQQQSRMRQYAYQQQYWERQRQLQLRWTTRRIDYANDPYFYTAASYRYQRGGRYYEINRYAADLLEQAIRLGYEEGVRAGEADRFDGWRGGYEDNFAYLDANYGYDGYYVSQGEYNHYFREGFRRGYEDGFGRRYRYGEARNGEYLILGSVLALILGLESF